LAIDTANKRRSISGYTGLVIAPVPDGAITAPDRLHIAWLYSGIAAGAGGGGTLPPGEGWGHWLWWGRSFLWHHWLRKEQ
jgi:hypothetical protein